jgi:general secretion pathway protein G
MVVAHDPSDAVAVLRPGPACASARTTRARDRERGFTFVELLVVMLIIGIITTAVAPTLLNQRARGSGPGVNVAAGAIWRSVQNYRIDNRGTFPPTSMVQPGPAFSDPAGQEYIRSWPEGPDGEPIRVRPGGMGMPPATMSSTGAGGVVVYGASGRAGWVAGYGADGRRVFVRGVSTTLAPMVPEG